MSEGSERRKRGIECLKGHLERLGRSLDGPVAVSKLYEPEESWTKTPVWWHNLSLARLQAAPGDIWYLVCDKADGTCCEHLAVPASSILDHLPGFCVVDGRVQLHLSARDSDLFTDLRGQGGVDFAQFLLG